MERTVLDAHVTALCHALDGEGGAGLSDYLDDQSCLHVAGSSGLGGDYQGHEAIGGLFDRLASVCGRSLRFERSCVSVTGSGAVRLCGTLEGRRGDRALATTVVAELSAAGRLIRDVRLECRDQPTWDAFWS